MKIEWEIMATIFSVLFAFCFAIGARSYSNNVDNEAMKQMVNKGWSPVQARCAVKGITDSMCKTEEKK